MVSGGTSVCCSSAPPTEPISAKTLMSAKQPYAQQPDRAFWRKAVAAEHVTQMTGLFGGVPGLASKRVATAGSCFAQHIGKALRARGLNYMDYEPAPPFLGAVDADRLGYGVYSGRYGNIYTVRQLRQLFEEAFGRRQPQDAIWTRDGRYYDALRPGMEPKGFGSIDEVRALRASHLARLRALFRELDLFVFTLGLTEAWASRQDGTVYPVAPGVIAGHYDPDEHELKNFRYPEVYEDLSAFLLELREINPAAQMLLTVSPVSLAATATANHVLVATTYSKSVLRAVAGDLAEDREGLFYFPSYEVITGAPTRHMYYNPDLRTVCQAGVNEVMRHFFAEAPGSSAAPLAAATAPAAAVEASLGYEHCEEALLDDGRPA